MYNNAGSAEASSSSGGGNGELEMERRKVVVPFCSPYPCCSASPRTRVLSISDQRCGIGVDVDTCCPDMITRRLRRRFQQKSKHQTPQEVRLGRFGVSELCSRVHLRLSRRRRASLQPDSLSDSVKSPSSSCGVVGKAQDFSSEAYKPSCYHIL